MKSGSFSFCLFISASSCSIEFFGIFGSLLSCEYEVNGIAAHIITIKANINLEYLVIRVSFMDLALVLSP